MNPFPDPILYDPARHTRLLPQLASLHIACIEHSFTIATFLPPLSHPQILAWWTERASEVSAGHRVIIMLLVPPSNTVNDASPESLGEVTGVVMLSKPVTQTGPFRGIVEKLFVAPSWRKRGVAKAMMRKLHEVARGEGRTMLLLDTETGSPAEVVYPRLGYVEVGIIPDYGISPKDGSLKAGTFYYKNLLLSEELTT